MSRTSYETRSTPDPEFATRNAPDDFREFRWIFTGVGRCGTGYASKVLQSVGVRCGHEDVFNRSGWDEAARKMRYGHWEADASWLAAPWLPRVREEFPDVRVVHLLRHPRDVIASWLANGVFGGEFGPWLRWALGHLQGWPLDAKEEDVAAWYFCEWTRLVEPHADCHIRVENGPLSILDTMGSRIVQGGRVFTDRRYNHRAEITRVPDLRELREPWRSDIISWCEEWGYNCD